MADYSGRQLGNYRLLHLIGKGGFAEVYLGEHVHLGTYAAVKVLHTQLTGEDVTRFRNEARTIARLEHPNIVRVLDFGLEGTTPYLAMSYAPNGSLGKRYPRGTRLPLTTIVSYIRQIAAALQYAHNEKYIHRDIKPDNLLIGRNNEVLLSDFGIALVAQSSRYRSTQEITGTAAYMSPEQIQGKPRPASDQYSLGIVIYEWLTGALPFHGSFTELCAQHMFASLPSLCQRFSDVPLPVEQVVFRALAKDPHQRFASVQEFAVAFEQALQSQLPTILPSSISPPPPLPPTQPVGTALVGGGQAYSGQPPIEVTRPEGDIQSLVANNRAKIDKVRQWAQNRGEPFNLPLIILLSMTEHPDMESLLEQELRLRFEELRDKVIHFDYSGEFIERSSVLFDPQGDLLSLEQAYSNVIVYDTLMQKPPLLIENPTMADIKAASRSKKNIYNSFMQNCLLDGDSAKIWKRAHRNNKEYVWATNYSDKMAYVQFTEQPIELTDFTFQADLVLPGRYELAFIFRLQNQTQGYYLELLPEPNRESVEFRLGIIRVDQVILTRKLLLFHDDTKLISWLKYGEVNWVPTERPFLGNYTSVSHLLLGIVAQGSIFDLYGNLKHLARINDPTISSGEICFYSSERNPMRCSRATVWTP